MCGGGSNVQEEIERQENVKGGLWYARTIFTIFILLLTIVIGMAGTIKIGLENKDLIEQKDAACELKASLYSFVVTILLHVLLLVLEIMYTCYLTQKRGCCACEFITIKTFCHIAGVLLTMMGIIIFSIDNADRIGWAFYLLIANLILSVINAIAYIGMNTFERYLSQKGVNVENLKRGLRNDD